MKTAPTTLSHHNQVILDELAMTLDYAQGLTLLLARCNMPALRQTLIAQLQQKLAQDDIHLLDVTFTEPVIELREQLGQRLTESQTGAKPVISIAGLELSIPYKAEEIALLTELNMGRELFHRDTPVPLLFWLPDYALTALAQKAQDFWAWRSGVFDFETEEADRLQTFEQVTQETGWITVQNLPGPQTQQRRSILESLWDEYVNMDETPQVMEQRIALLYSLAQINKVLHDIPQTIDYWVQYLNLIRARENHLHEESNALHGLGMAYDARGDYERALTYLEESLKISQEIGDIAGLCATLFNMGHIYYYQKDDHPTGLQMWREVYQLAQPIKLAQVLDALENLANELELPAGLESWAMLGEDERKKE